MTKTTFAYRFASHRFAAIGLALLFVASTVGCQSSSGSRWAWWNPMSSSSEDTTLVARTAPALPSDTATPLIEGVAAPATAVASTAPAAKSSNPTLPTIETASTAPAFNSSPTAEASKIASTPQLPTKPVDPTVQADPAIQAPSYPIAAIPAMQTPAAQSAAGGPYDPNGYKETAPTTVASTTPSSSDDRYGNLGNRYASSPATTTPASSYQPSVAQTSPAATSAALTSPTTSPATTPATNSTVGDRYGSYAAAPASSYQPAATNQVSSSASVTESLPSPPSTPVNRYAATTPAYPSTPATTTPAVTTPIASTPRYPETSSQVANAATQATGAVVASNSKNLGSEVRLVSSPGEYRPGGTSTYPTSMNIATKPDSPGSSVATPTYPSSGNRYK